MGLLIRKRVNRLKSLDLTGIAKRTLNPNINSAGTSLPHPRSTDPPHIPGYAEIRSEKIR